MKTATKTTSFTYKNQKGVHLLLGMILMRNKMKITDIDGENTFFPSIKIT